jgi:Uma2 family endonuclease
MDSTMAVAQRMTVAEFLELDTPRCTWLVEGEVVVNPPRPLHQGVERELMYALEAWRRAAPGRGECWARLGTVLDEHNYYEPDILWYAAGRELGRSEQPLQPMPDIAAEIRSPSTWRYDIGAKKARYEQYGLPELWLVDTAADVVLIFRRSTARAPAFDVSLELARGDSLSSPLLPGFALALDELFGPPPAGATG